MIKVLPCELIYKMAKFSDPSNPGSLVSTKGSDVLGIKDVVPSGVLGLPGVRKGTEKNICVVW